MVMNLNTQQFKLIDIFPITVTNKISAGFFCDRTGQEYSKIYIKNAIDLEEKLISRNMEQQKKYLE